MALPCRIKRGMGATWLAVLLLCAGCSQAVMLTNETENGGIVTYLFKEDRGGPMGSPHRREAIQVMEKKCPSGYTVIKDTAACRPWKVQQVTSSAVGGGCSFGVRESRRMLKGQPSVFSHRSVH